MASLNRYCSTCNNLNRNDMYCGRKKLSNAKNMYSQLQNHADFLDKGIFQEYENKIVCELLSQLTSIKNEKSKLESEKEVLKTEFECLKIKHQNFVDINKREKEDLKECIEKLKKEVKFVQLEKVSLTNSYLEEQRKYLEQIGELRNSLINTLDDKDGSIKKLTKAKGEIENKLKKSLTEIEEIKKSTATFKKKSANYKNKLKLATEYISQLVHEVECSAVAKVDNESQTTNNVLQIDETENIPNSCINGYANLDETENILLSELFFNVVPPNDDADSLFINQSYEPIHQATSLETLNYLNIEFNLPHL